MPARAYRILSLDGGGIRGWMTVRLIERLGEEVPGWWRRADLLAGTSTGGLIALGLAAALEPATLRHLYESAGPQVFHDTWMDNVRDLGRLVGAQYDERPLRRVLEKTFGDLRLRDLRCRVLVPAFDLDNEHPDPARRGWAPKFFHNFPGPDSDGERRVRDVALYTSVAPVHFPSADGYIDGGVVANNPSMAALAQTQDGRSRQPRPALSRIVLLSIGTGGSPKFIPGRRLDWGLGQWSRPLLDILMEGGIGVPDYQCRRFLGERYHRLNPLLPPGLEIRMNDVVALPRLKDFAEQLDLADTTTWLQTYWNDPSPPRRRPTA